MLITGDCCNTAKPDKSFNIVLLTVQPPLWPPSHTERAHQPPLPLHADLSFTLTSSLLWWQPQIHSSDCELSLELSYFGLQKTQRAHISSSVIHGLLVYFISVSEQASMAHPWQHDGVNGQITGLLCLLWSHWDVYFSTCQNLFSDYFACQNHLSFRCKVMNRMPWTSES